MAATLFWLHVSDPPPSRCGCVVGVTRWLPAGQWKRGPQGSPLSVFSEASESCFSLQSQANDKSDVCILIAFASILFAAFSPYLAALSLCPSEHPSAPLSLLHTLLESAQGLWEVQALFLLCLFQHLHTNQVSTKPPADNQVTRLCF